MKNILLQTIKWVCAGLGLFGIFGALIGVIEEDFELIAFYIGWAAIFIFISCLISKKYRSVKPPKQKQDTVQPTKQHRVEDVQEPVVEKNTVQKKKLPEFPSLYIVLDLETPNRSNDRISQIGLLVVYNGNILKNFSSLINPECKFDPINTKITGLTSEKVSRAPSFDRYWPRIKVLFTQCVIVCHNADFDLNVLSKTLKHYNFEMPKIKYVCTFLEAKNKFPEFQKYSLPFLAKHFEIHCGTEHNAAYDANVCYKFFELMKGKHFDFIVRDFENRKEKESAPPTLSFANYAIDNKEIDIPFSEFPDIEITGKKFVLTGVFTDITRSEITEYIEENGGNVTGSVSGKTDFLIVGNEIEPKWKHGNYGNKIEKATELIESQKTNIQIIRESDFLEQFNL